MSEGAEARLRPIADDLQRIFGTRLEALVGYGWRPRGPAPSLALVTTLTLDDLSACAARTSSWHRAGCATPLVLTPREFTRSLDAFPIEFGEILATSHVVAGSPIFDGLAIARDDMRRAIEVQVKSLLLHVREDYLEGSGRPANVGALVRESAPAFVAVLRHLARLDNAAMDTTGGLVAYASRRIRLDERLVGDAIALTEAEGVSAVDAIRSFPAYLAAIERLAEFVDEWRQP